MKFIVIIGPHAVGKMTVAQELAKITGFKLLHNHMTIELINGIFDVFSTPEGKRLNSQIKRRILEEVASSNLSGFILTAMVAFDVPSSFEAIKDTINLFKEKSADIYIFELTAEFNVRLERNKTTNRLAHKPSKRNLQESEKVFKEIESEHRLTSLQGELSDYCHTKIDNTDLPAEKVAQMISKKIFNDVRIS